MKRFYLSKLIILIVLFSGWSVNAISQSLVFSQSFTSGATATSQCSAWTAYTATLLSSYNYTSVTISGSNDATGRTCTDPTITAAIAAALRTGSAYGPTVSGINTWQVSSTAGDGWGEITCTPGNIGFCNSPGYDLRPCISNSNWGGIDGATCGAATQTMTVTFNYAGILYTATSPQSISVCQNSGATALNNSLLSTTDLTTGLTETWSVSTAPVHGSVSGFPVTGTTTSGTSTPAGSLTYTPTAGFSGIDSFKIKASDGSSFVNMTFIVTVIATPAAITGNTCITLGQATGLSDVTSPGTWSSSSTTIATVNSASGVVTSISLGTSVINYITSAGCPVSTTVTVSAFPVSISGNANACVGITTSPLTDATPGGVWTSANTAQATVGLSSGLVTGVTAGTVPTIIYTLSNGCFTTIPVTVNTNPSSISGTTPICGSQSATFTDATSGGVWSSGNTSIASVAGGSGTAIVTAGSAGGTNITYTSAAGCPISFSMVVTPFSAITGVSGVCNGSTATLSDATSGGIWSSSNTGVATINSSGLVTSVTFGGTTISYSIASSGCTATKVFNVTGIPNVYTMSGGGVYCSGGSGGSGVVGAHVILNGSDAGVSYQLFNGATPVGAAITGSGSLVDFGLQPVGCYGAIANPFTSCATTMTGSVCVSVNPLPTAYTVSGGGSYCAGGTGVTVNLNGSSVGITYQLFVTAGGTTVPVGATAVGTSAPISFGLQTVAGTYTVQGTNTVTGCIGNMSGSVTITTNPLPASQTVTASGSGFCLGGTGVTIGLTGSVIGTSYQLTFGGAPFGAAVAGTGGPISFGPQTTGGTYVVTATTTATGCTTTMSGTPSVTVNTLPVPFNVTGGGNYCVSSTTGVPIGLNGSAVGINYQLFYTAIGGTAVPVAGALVAGTGASISFGASFTNLGSYSVQAISPATTCTNNMTGSVAIGTYPLPAVVSVGGGGPYCAGTTPPHVTLSGSSTGTIYNLLNGTTLAGAVSGTGATVDFGAEPTPGTYTAVGAIVYGTVTCTVNMLGSTTVSINPLPNTFNVQAISAAGTSYCNSPGALGDTISLNGSASGISYQLFNGGVASGTAVAGTGSPISFGPHTAGAYTVVATNILTSCINNMTGSVAITSNALPTVYALTGGGNFCAGGSGVPIGLTASNSGISYSLLRGGTTVSTLPGAGAAISFGLQSVPGTYTITASNPVTTCSVNMSGSTVVSVNPLPVATYSVTVPNSGNYCAGSTGPVISLSSSDAGINYQLLLGGIPPPGTAPVAGIAGSPISFPPQTANGTYTVQAMNSTTGCMSTEAGNAVITMNALPLVYTVSGGGTAFCSGGAGITVTLSGTQNGVSYQLWNAGGTVSTPITGAGSAITFPAVTASGSYTVVGTNASGCSSTMSGSAVVNIIGSPTLYAITGGGAYCQGGTGVPVGMLSSSIGTNYQLMLAGVPVGAPVAGTGSAFSFGSSFTIAGAYTVVATIASTGCSTTMTGTATVSINLLPPVHNITGGGNYCPGGTGSIVNLDGSNTSTSYQLYAGSAPAGAAVSGSGAPITFGPHTTTGIYTVIATNATCTGNMSGSVTIGLNTLPVVFNVTGGGNICPSGSVAVGLSGSSLSAGYQLYNSLSGPLGPVVPGTGFSLNFGSQTAAGAYTVVAIANTTSCTSNMSGSATVVINPLPNAHTVTGGGSYCQGTGGMDVGVDGSDIGTHYQLYIGGVTPVGSYMPGTGMPLDFGPQAAAGNYTVVATSTATTCSNNMTGSAVVSITALPAAEIVTGGGNYCAGSAAGGISNVGLDSSETGVNYQLYNGASPVGIPVAGTGGALNFGLLTAAGVYTVVGNEPSTTCSNAMSGSATIVVNAPPTVYTVVGGGNYCAGGAGVHVKLSGSNTGITYQLMVNSIATGAPMPGTGSLLDFGPQTAAGSYTVMAMNNSTTCTNMMNGSVAVTINPLPNVYTIIGTGTNYCAGGPGIDMTLSGSDAGISYQLYKGSTTAGGAITGTGFSIDLGYQAASGTYTVIAVNPSTTCNDTMTGTANVVINPLPTAFTVAGGGSYCNGGTGVNVGLSSSNTGISYQLWNSTTSTAAGAAIPGTGIALNFGLQTSAGTYTVVATNMATSCTNTMSGLAVIMINVLPPVTTVTGGGNYCSGSAGAHVGLSGTTAGINYQLYDGVTPLGAPMGGTGLGIDFGPQTGAGSYTVMAINTATGCSDAMAGSVAVGINLLPTPYPMTGGGNYCPGSGGVNVGISNSGTGISYQLYNGTAPVGATWPGTGSAINFGMITTAGIYTVIATNTGTGCSGNMSGTATVGVNPQPTVYSVIGGGNYCAGSGGVHVGLNSSDTDINYQLVVSGGSSGAPVSGAGGPLDFGLQTTAGSYSVVATNGTTGCTSTMSGTPTVVITPLVTPSVTLSTGTGNDTICSGHLVTLSALVSNGGTTPVYVWSVNGTPQSATGSTFSYLPASGDVVTATVTSNAACATPPTVGASIALTVLENGLPTVTVSSVQGTNVCSGTMVTYTTATTFGGTAPILTWVVNSTNVSNAATYAYIPLNNDDIYVEMNSNYRCRSASPVSSNHITMSVADSVVPTVTISANPTGANIAHGQQLTLTASVTNGGPIPAYQWFVNGVLITGANLQTYTNDNYANGDSVTCQVVSSGICTGLLGFNSVIVHVSNVGVKQITAAGGDIQVVPNPSKGLFVVKGTMSTTTDEEVTIEITDMLGQVVYTGKTMAHNGSINERIQLNSGIANGIYILSLHSDTDNKVFHIVIEQ